MNDGCKLKVAGWEVVALRAAVVLTCLRHGESSLTGLTGALRARYPGTANAPHAVGPVTGRREKS